MFVRKEETDEQITNLPVSLRNGRCAIMIGQFSPQMSLHDVGSFFTLQLSEGSFFGQLAKAAAGGMFKDNDFAGIEIYCEDNGRPSVPPSQLALLMLMQAHDGVSDARAVDSCMYDARYCAVLRQGIGDRLCSESTLRLFRAHLVINDNAKIMFRKSVDEAKRVGLLKGEALKVATDTKPIEGRGAVEDTYNLLATGIGMLVGALSKKAGKNKAEWMSEFGLGRYSQSSVKGSADIDWSDKEAKAGLLTEIVTDARKLLGMANGQGKEVKAAADLLMKLLQQDVEETTDGKPSAKIKEGTAKGRIPSATDPEVRHGRKSRSKRFNGHKAAIVTDIDSGIIVSLDVLSGDSADSVGALELIEQAEEITGIKVAETSGDCAYGSGATRQEFKDKGRTLVAKVPQENENRGLFKKSEFTIDLEANTVTCPAGHTPDSSTGSADGSTTFHFDGHCTACPLRARCTTSKSGRSLTVHAQERILREAREYQSTPEGKAHLRKRVIVENSLARLAHLGIGQARYIGRKRTRFQLAITCAVANLRRSWNWAWEQTVNSEVIGGPVGVIGQKMQPSAA